MFDVGGGCGCCAVLSFYFGAWEEAVGKRGTGAALGC